jgi:hypothetical protein
MFFHLLKTLLLNKKIIEFAMMKMRMSVITINVAINKQLEMLQYMLAPCKYMKQYYYKAH